jgi:hypothetical protein
MAYKALTVAELLSLMKNLQGEKTATQFASELGISKQYLCDLYSGRKTPSDTVSAVLGYASLTEIRYVPSTTKGKPEATREKDSKSKAARSGKRHSR